jgi:hypothetical protein
MNIRPMWHHGGLGTTWRTFVSQVEPMNIRIFVRFASPDEQVALFSSGYISLLCSSAINIYSLVFG